MLPSADVRTGPWVILLHWLGGSARTWGEVSDGLRALGTRPMAIDLPGFGLAAEEGNFSTQAMVEQVIVKIQTLRLGEENIPWLLAGHSMGGKVAALCGACRG